MDRTSDLLAEKIRYLHTETSGENKQVAKHPNQQMLWQTSSCYGQPDFISSLLFITATALSFVPNIRISIYSFAQIHLFCSDKLMLQMTH